MIKHTYCNVNFQWSFIKQTWSFLLILLFISSTVSAQNEDNFSISQNSSTPKPALITNESALRKVPAATLLWTAPFDIYSDGSYTLSIQSPIPFSFLGVGWKSDDSTLNSKDFTIQYRTRATNRPWSIWTEVYGITSPQESPSEFYWSDILFVDDSILHHECELRITPPTHQNINTIRVDLVNMKSYDSANFMEKSVTIEKLQPNMGCHFPTIIERKDWCGGYADCKKPTYTPTIIHPTHVVLHHGASPDTYTDGYAVVRSYWNYHVYSNGWDDIGYNYLIDKEGNIFQGRENQDMEHQDVKGSHAGSSNTNSIGICFLGNSDVTHATDKQLARLEQLLAWWFQSRGFDPTTQASISNQAGNQMVYLPRIIGHQDVKPGTLCPGDNVYELLPSIREESKNQLITCSDIQPLFDCKISQAKVNSSNMKAGETITIQYVHEITSDNLKTNIQPVEVSFWLSSDGIFNPNQNLLLHETVDSLTFNDISNTPLSHSFQLNASIATGNYTLFIVSDLGNELYESDETNNQISTNVSVTGLSFDITATANSPERGTIKGMGRLKYGDTCTLSATANYGYTFINWIENGNIVSTNPDYMFIVKINRTLQAHFECTATPPPPTIVGDTVVCAKQMQVRYTIPEALTMNNVIWTLPSGTTGISSTNTILVNYSKEAQSGKIIAQFATNCFSKVESSLNIHVKPVPEAPLITSINGMLRSNCSAENQWYYNDLKINKATDLHYIPSNKGDYWVVTTLNGCTSSPSNSIKYDPQKSNQIAAENIFIPFPNPTKGKVEIIFAETLFSYSSIDIFNMAGRKIESHTYPIGIRLAQIDLSNYESGVYLLQVTINKQIYSAKILKEN